MSFEEEDRRLFALLTERDAQRKVAQKKSAADRQREYRKRKKEQAAAEKKAEQRDIGRALSAVLCGGFKGHPPF